jgi:FKBP-type peptidyl-prolyl cis-trans isomerase (trigger factor)
MQNDILVQLAKAFSLKTLPHSEVELAGDIPAESIAPYRETALKHLAEHVELPGFRPGKVPLDMVLKKLGEVAVLEEAVELFMQDFYPTLLEGHKVDAVGRPDIRITKLAPGNPVGLVIHAPIYPEVELPKNWKTIGEGVAEEPSLPATEEEIAQTIDSLRKSRAVPPTPVEGEEAVHKEPALPELTDEFAKSLGAFETVAALKEQITKGITEEKARAAKDTRRGKIIEALLEKVKIEIPAIFVDSELDKIIAQLKEDIARFNIPYDDYLKRIGKTEEALREEFREQARKRAKLQLTLNKIAEQEKIEPEKDLVESEIKHAFEHFPDAKPDLLRIHVETVLRNEKVLQMLEGKTN